MSKVDCKTCPYRGKDHCRRIIGVSPVIRKIHDSVSKVALSNASVLIQGESGTGKELTARSVHCYSSRNSYPFVTINCSVFTETLLESELFGHAKGSFTGAFADRKGRFEVADGGTVFLDEIGELSPYMQVKLLRVLQEKEFERVGETQKRITDVRIIAATNKDLKKLVEQGKFREDLYYRVKVFPITLPPLRARTEDIPLLVDHFIKINNEETLRNNRMTNIKGLTPEAMSLLMKYYWKGNIRELLNAIEYSFVVCTDTVIKGEDLPEEIIYGNKNPIPISGDDWNLRGIQRLRQMTSNELKNFLEQCQWNKAEAGRRLGVSRTTIWTYLKKHRIPLNNSKKNSEPVCPFERRSVELVDN